MQEGGRDVEGSRSRARLGEPGAGGPHPPPRRPSLGRKHLPAMSSNVRLEIALPDPSNRIRLPQSTNSPPEAGSSSSSRSLTVSAAIPMLSIHSLKEQATPPARGSASSLTMFEETEKALFKSSFHKSNCVGNLEIMGHPLFLPDCAIGRLTLCES